ncbi:MAG TPA: thiamine pyrophosphate-dependent enzyme [Solirubrobacteraceae bacterium]|jgi:acetolactate synthase-1/2/3 large subunit|nr:thiamine pyrophosphate-dependent enzyme [Solirubrobacteraceae bacterium]
MSNPRPGGRILVDQLRRHGVPRVFGVPGESYLAVLDALHDTPQLEFVVCRMEAGAANMACAHGQLTGSPGVCIVTRGPGAAHAAVGVHTARQGSVPMVLLVGQVPRDHRGREAFQEVDIEAMFAPLAKWTATIDDPARIPEYLNRAMRLATAGRPGPVVLALPEDMLAQATEVADIVAGGIGDSVAEPVAGPAPAPIAVARARDLVGGAQRPLMIVGGGGWSALAAENALALARSWGLPVATAFRCQDYVDNRSDAYAGALGLGADPRLARRVADADLLLVIGARLDEPTTGGYGLIAPPRPRQALIHVHADPDELGAVFEPALGIVAGSAEFAAAALALQAPDATRWAPWTGAAAEDVRAFKRPAAGAPAGGVDLAAGVAELCATVAPETIVTNGAGNYTLWAHRYWTFERFGTQLGPVSGAMGYGVPAGIAAKLAHPDRPVLSFNGDGCFLMCGQELATAVRHRAGVVFVVIDNGSYGTIRMHQERRYPGRPVATDLVNPDFVAYARSFGVQARSVADTAAFVEAVRAGLAADRPALVHVPASPEVFTPPPADSPSS